jgi:hypothetical protein
LQFQGAFATIDFFKNTGVTELTNKVVIPINSELQDVMLTPSKLPNKKGVKILFLRIEFLQQTGSTLYELYNAEYDGMEIVGIS